MTVHSLGLKGHLIASFCRHAKNPWICAWLLCTGVECRGWVVGLVHVLMTRSYRCSVPGQRVEDLLGTDWSSPWTTSTECTAGAAIEAISRGGNSARGER